MKLERKEQTDCILIKAIFSQIYILYLMYNLFNFKQQFYTSLEEFLIKNTTNFIFFIKNTVSLL